MWAEYEEIQKFTTVNPFSKITDIGSLELYAKSFQVNGIRENLPPHIENARRKPQTWRERLDSRDLQWLEVRGKLRSKTLYYAHQRSTMGKKMK